MSTESLNCTQFLEQYPPPDSEEAKNFTFPWIFVTVGTAYDQIHDYLFIFVIVFNVTANFTVLVVLSKKEMRSVGVNVTMMMITACDFFCSVSVLVQMLLEFTTAMWQSPKYALLVALALCAPVFACATMAFFLFTIYESDENGVYLDYSDLSLKNGCLYMKLYLLMIGSYYKAIPCIMMLVLSLKLLSQIEDGKKSSVNAASKQKENTQKMDRSSRFIQIVLVAFLVAETPQALLSIAGGLFFNDYLNYYQSVGNIINLLAFINAGISFVIYSTLSGKFRKLFARVFFPKSLTDKIYKKHSSVAIVTNTARETI